MRTFNVVFCEFKRVTKRVINVTLSRKVHDSVYFLFFEDVIQQIDGTNVPLDELDVQQMLYMVQVFQAGTVVKFVEYDDLFHECLSRQSAVTSIEWFLSSSTSIDFYRATYLVRWVSLREEARNV